MKFLKKLSSTFLHILYDNKWRQTDIIYKDEKNEANIFQKDAIDLKEICKIGIKLDFLPTFLV